ncbi:MAG: PilZ domain-containing protein [Myxococcota bacterium]|nr:PilZ domain-containing protein [Myxococcota bacterium]
MPTDRREMLRVPDNRIITEIFSEQPDAASVVNISNTGLFTVKPSSLVSSPTVHRGKGAVQLEIPVPEASESIWALGEVIFERSAKTCVGSGIRFVSMADRHQRLIRDLVEIRKQDVLAHIIREMRYRRELAAYPSQFNNSLSPLTEDSVRMYLFPKH